MGGTIGVLQRPEQVIGQGEASACAVHKADGGKGVETRQAAFQMRLEQDVFPMLALVLGAVSAVFGVGFVEIIVYAVGFQYADAFAQGGLGEGVADADGDGFACVVPSLGVLA